MVVNYGTTGPHDIDLANSDEESELSHDGNENIPCPIIQFRVANELHGNRSGEILDASLNIIATVDAHNCIALVKTERVFGDALKHGPQRHSHSPVNANLKKGNTVKNSVLTSATSAATSATQKIFSPKQELAAARSDRLSDLAQFRKSVSTKHLLTPTYAPAQSASTRSEDNEQVSETEKMDEAMMHGISSDDIVVQELDRPNLVYANVNFEPSFHPFFKRTWVVSHR